MQMSANKFNFKSLKKNLSSFQMLINYIMVRVQYTGEGGGQGGSFSPKHPRLPAPLPPPPKTTIQPLPERHWFNTCLLIILGILKLTLINYASALNLRFAWEGAHPPPAFTSCNCLAFTLNPTTSPPPSPKSKS